MSSPVVAEITGTAGTVFAIAFAIGMGLFGRTVIAIRMPQTASRDARSTADSATNRGGTVVATAAVAFAFMLLLFLVEPLPWWLLVMSGAGLLWAVVAETLLWRGRHSG